MMTYKWILFSIIGLGALAFAFFLGRATGDAEKESAAHVTDSDHAGEEHGGSNTVVLDPEALERFDIKVERVQSRTLQQSIEATGSVQVNESRLVHVRPLARGRIHDVYVRLGDRVKAGQPLLTYDNIELGEVLGQYVAALADIQKSSAETGVARRALERARSLVELGAIARGELQKREAEYQNALSETESRKAKAAQIEEKLHRFGMTDPEIRKITPNTDADYHREASHSVLRAPLEGVVTQFNAAPGENIDPEDEIMTISDLAIVWVQADVYEKDIRLVHEGGTAEVRVAAQPGRIFPGKITYVGDVLDPQTRTAKVRVEVSNPDRLLKIEMFASVTIPVTSTRLALMAPSEAIHQIENATVAFVKRENGFEKRAVTAGEKAGAWTEIKGGLREGELIVTEGSFLLKSEAMKDELGDHDH